MNRKSLYVNSLILVALPLLLVAFQNCDRNLKFESATATTGKSNPSGGQVTQPGAQPPVPSTGPAPLKMVNLSLQSISQQGAVDVVWVVDNSASMDAAADHVRTNISRFANKVRSQTNLRMALISDRGNSGTAVSLPSDPDFIQIDHHVNSWNALLLVASSLCSTSNAPAPCKALESKSSGAFQTVAHEIKDYPYFISSDVAGDINDAEKSDIRGRLVSFLGRTEAKKIFVVVSDDNSELLPGAFLDVARTLPGGQSPVVFSFANLKGFAAGYCSQNGTLSSVYINLAAMTGGQAFDVCAQTWDSTFDLLADQVNAMVSHLIHLPIQLKSAKILSVVVNNHPIDAANYSIQGNDIVFSAAANAQLAGASSVQVFYE